jgi:peptidoglycan/xylan/chitin deacetylase (PgdA/CDA1 family)
MMARTVRAGAQSAVKATAAVADIVRRPARGLVVLVYHRVGARSPMAVDLPTAMFEEQIAWLASSMPVMSLDEGLAWLTADPVDRRARSEDEAPVEPLLGVAITFDDGTADFADEAVPVLARYRVPVTLYVATDFVERGAPFPYGGVPLSWSALRDVCSSGLVTVGSHTHTHALLDRLTRDRVDDELDRSVSLIGDRLGVVARHFAYPKAVPGSPAADAAVRERFVSAALAGGRANRPGATDVFRLSRTPVQRSDRGEWFRRKARGGLAVEDMLRGWLNRARYSGATT